MSTAAPRSASPRSAAPDRGGPLRLLGLLALLALVLTAGAPSVIRIGPGDTLSELAHRYHTSVAALRALNHLPGNAPIYAGALLRVPPPAPRVRPYAVRRGDTLTGLAARFGTTTTDLRRRNHLRRDRLRPGQHLLVAVRATAATATAPGRPTLAPVQRSAARHRSVLAARSQPSRAAVRRLIVSSSRRNGVDPSFALAVAYQESGFQQRVVSPVDAIGVMQVLPSTGVALARAFHRRFDLLQARDNVDAGVLLLAQLLRSTPDWRAALAGYYQGLGSIRAQGLLPQTHAYIRSVAVLRPRFRNG